MTTTAHPATDPAAGPASSNKAPVKPGTIVVGVDGSPESDLAVRWAAEQAAAEGRTLTLVNATRPSQAWAESYGYDAQLGMAAETAGTALLMRSVATVTASFPELHVQVRRVAVDPRQALLGLAEHARMVVVGSRGRGMLARLVLGSVSTAVTRHAACPVVVVRPREAGAGVQGILLGVDRDGHSPAAVEFAYHQASVRRLPLTVTHCCFDSFDVAASGGAIGTDVIELPYDTEGYEDSRLVLDATVAGMAEKYPDVQVTLALGLRPVDYYLVAASRTRDMVVVGAHAGVVPLAFLVGRDTEHKLVTRSPAIVAVVPEPSYGSVSRG